MSELIKAELIEDAIYPLTIIADRYSGTYSGGKFTAWNVFPQNIPDDVESEDVECMMFWDKKEYQHLTNDFNEPVFVGFGETPDKALLDLYIKIKQHETDKQRSL
jgi:hypothetical protein